MIKTFSNHFSSYGKNYVTLPSFLKKTHAHDLIKFSPEALKEIAYQFEYLNSQPKHETDILKHNLHHNALEAFRYLRWSNALTIEFDEPISFINQFVVGIGGLLNQSFVDIQAKEFNINDLYSTKQFHTTNSASPSLVNTLLVQTSSQDSDSTIIHIADNEIIYDSLSQAEKKCFEAYYICLKRGLAQVKNEQMTYEEPIFIKDGGVTKLMSDGHTIENQGAEVKRILEKIQKLAESIALPIHLKANTSLTLINTDRTLHRIDPPSLTSKKNKIQLWYLKKIDD